jgi:hypothetical protein
MADEVYEGAIGIDLGMSKLTGAMFPPGLDDANRCLQAPHIRVLRTMKEQTWRSVSWNRHSSHHTGILISTIVANEQGNFTTPSFVSFTDEERLIGEAAKNQAAMNPVNTIFDIK